MKVLLTTLNAKYVHSSLALRSLAAYCQRQGVPAGIKEYTINQSLFQIMRDIYREYPQVLGIACYIWNIRMVLELCSLIKKVMPEIQLILGGPEVSYDPEELLQLHKNIDYLVLGEGEEALANLLRCIADKVPCQVPGVAFRRIQGGDTATYQTVRVLDEIPFAYGADDLEILKERIIYYETSRGCPFSCQYCLSSASSGVRYYSLQRVMEDLQKFIDHDVKQVKFVDRTFNARKDHYLPILRFLANTQCRTNFHLEIAADLLDDEAISILQTAPVGRFQLEIGIQSIHEPTLAAVCRKNDWEKIKKNVSTLRETKNMHLHVDLIVGLPFETMELFSRSFNAVYDLQPHMLQIGFLKLLKGSGIRNTAHVHEYVYSDEAPYEVLANRYLSYSEVRQLQLLEDVFNLTYNSGRFPATLKYVVERLFQGDAFKLYYALSCLWEKEKMDLVSHSPKTLYEVLIHFCQTIAPSQVNVLMEFLKFDALTTDNGSLRPDFLPWHYVGKPSEEGNFWRDEESVGCYLPGYRFSSWRDIKRHYQLELFTVDVAHYLATGEITQQEVAILFDYRSYNPSFVRLAANWRSHDAL